MKIILFVGVLSAIFAHTNTYADYSNECSTFSPEHDKPICEVEKQQESTNDKIDDTNRKIDDINVSANLTTHYSLH